MRVTFTIVGPESGHDSLLLPQLWFFFVNLVVGRHVTDLAGLLKMNGQVSLPNMQSFGNYRLYAQPSHYSGLHPVVTRRAAEETPLNRFFHPRPPSATGLGGPG